MCASQKQSSYYWWQRGKGGRLWMHGWYDSHNIMGAKGRRPLHFQQQCAGCHITLAVLHRNKCQHKCGFNPWTHIYKADNHQKRALSHTLSINFFFKACSYQTSRSTFPQDHSAVEEWACLAVWDQPTLIMTWVIYSSVAECGCSGRGKWNKQNQKAWDKFVMYEEGRKKEIGKFKKLRATR